MLRARAEARRVAIRRVESMRPKDRDALDDAQEPRRSESPPTQTAAVRARAGGGPQSFCNGRGVWFCRVSDIFDDPFESARRLCYAYYGIHTSDTLREGETITMNVPSNEPYVAALGNARVWRVTPSEKMSRAGLAWISLV